MTGQGAGVSAAPGPQRATSAQVEASDPRRSVWVAANAGSGKTRVLTARVARLLLAGSPPERILCLTYTKAAAAEMQHRLFALLGGWAMADDASLAAAIAAIEDGAEAPPAPAPTRLREARRLFARALETPGGLKIQTIHAFCAGLLRRFPLEAGVSPRFREIDGREGQVLRARIRARLAAEAEAGGDDAFDRVAARLDEGSISALVDALIARRTRLAADPGVLEALFPPEARAGEAEAWRIAQTRFPREATARLAALFAAHGGKEAQKRVARLDTAVQPSNAPAEERLAPLLGGCVLTVEGTPNSRVMTKGIRSADPEADALWEQLGTWAVETAALVRAVRTLERSRDLDRFARAFLAAYEEEKAARGLLDFDDLIEATRRLLVEAEMGAWVLYKLDQGLDHILVDEAQDTSPAQWAVIAALAEEFHAGLGARGGTPRTVFAVGDQKQSIYSFQGAEPQAFEDMRARIEGRLAAIGRPLAAPKLLTSYRSAPAILRAVDRVFEDGAAGALGPEPPRHEAHRAHDGGRVDLWPLVPREKAVREADWTDPVDAVPETDARLRLAERLADEIARMTREARLPDRAGSPGRRVAPGDILVLVRRRDRLARRLVRALKARGVAVAGADRLDLATEIAARDLMALLAVLAMPSDDLSLAAVLRSPLCGVSEDALFDLAHDRTGRLWDAVREAGGPAAALLGDLAGKADFLRPYEMLERVLAGGAGGHDGRRRLLARLGPEAEDAIDELLAQALAYEAAEPPSLAGFLSWMGAEAESVQRQVDRSANEVRIMTVHGAKGLEAPVVILPDTTSAPGGGRQGPQLLPAAGDPDGDPGADAGGDWEGHPPLLWLGRTEEDDPVAARAREAQKAREAAEHARLLYVAMTRAEDWLIVCGAELGQKAEGSWYDRVAPAIAALGPEPREAPEGIPGPILRLEDRPAVPPPTAEAGPGAASPDSPADRPAGRSGTPRAPGWLAPAAPERRTRRPTPSGLAGEGDAPGAGAAAGAEPALLGAEAARRHGIAVHALLEHLPGAPEEARDALAAQILGAEPAPPDPDAALAEAMAVLADPALARLFGPGSLAEVALAIDPPGGRAPGAARMIGRADRILVEPGRITVVDIKTDRAPPADPAALSPAYRAQIEAYASAAAAAWPGREVRMALLWTATGALMDLGAPA